MEALSEKQFKKLARVVEITSDGVVVCQADGTVEHVNRQMTALLQSPRERIIGSDIKDLLFSVEFERASGHKPPFTLDGEDNSLMLKLIDGSFVPVLVRALKMVPPRLFIGSKRKKGARLLVTVRSLEEEYAHDRQMQRLLSQLQAANKRLSGTLSIIMSTVGSENMPQLLDTVLNKLTDTLDADGATVYFAENGGFKLRGVSRGLRDGLSYVPDFVPFGAGVATYVLRAGSSCRFSIVPPRSGDGSSAASFYDLDARVATSLRLQDVPPFKTLIAVPVFFGTQVLGIIELGWKRPTTPRVSDVRVLEVICDYLSIELVGLVSNVRAQRTAELTRSLNSLRDTLFASAGSRQKAWREMVAEVCRTLSCHLCPVAHDAVRDRYIVDFEGGGAAELPGSVEQVFFSTTAPASRTCALRGGVFSTGELPGAGEHLDFVRMVRVDAASFIGRWLDDHGLPCQGVFVDLGPDAGNALKGERSAFEEGPAGAGSAAPGDTGTLALAARATPHRMFLFLRDGTQEPIDDMEYDYLERLARDYELIDTGARGHESQRRIAQTLQAGMRNAVGDIPGIVTDALYSSATKQALVGGDFYTLIRLPDERAVMILGDVSGKGVEAASMAAMAKTALTAYAWEGLSPVAMVRALNHMLVGFSRVETFVTAFVAKLDLRAGTATYCSAGHPPTILVTPGGELEALAVQSGVVGAFDSMAYAGGTFAFEAGDILFMYTDGAIEARDGEGAFFGEQRLRDCLLRASAEGVHGLCGKVLAALDAFSASELDDDIALVALRLDGTGEKG